MFVCYVKTHKNIPERCKHIDVHSCVQWYSVKALTLSEIHCLPYCISTPIRKGVFTYTYTNVYKLAFYVFFVCCLCIVYYNQPRKGVSGVYLAYTGLIPRTQCMYFTHPLVCTLHPVIYLSYTTILP